MKVFSLISCFCFQWLLLLISECPGLNQGELCDKDGMQSLKVKAAFKAGDYIGLLVEIQAKDKQSNRTAIRVMYYPKDDISESTEHDFYETNYWPEVGQLDEVTNDPPILYAFSTRHMRKIFDKKVDKREQKSTELQFFVFGVNTTYGFEFNTEKPDPFKDPTFELLNSKMVYNPVTDEDDSGFLSLKLLYLHFPPAVHIKAIMIFERIIEENKQIFYAMVYTSEEFQSKTYYFRHYMRATVVEYEETFLEWSRDSASGQCQELDKQVDAVVLLRSIQSSKSLQSGDTQAEEESDEFTVYFVEFYGEFHKLMTIKFNGSSEVMSIDGEGNEAISNKEAFIHCEKHPELHPYQRIECLDYPKDESDQIIGEVGSNSDDSGSSHSSDSSTTKFWLWLGIIAAIIGIILLIAFGVYLVVAPKRSVKEDELNVENADKDQTNRTNETDINKN